MNQDATLLAVLSALSGIAKRAKPSDLVFIFIAGHGAPDRSRRKICIFLSDTKAWYGADGFSEWATQTDARHADPLKEPL